MGWADCGTDSKDRPIGYAHRATCDHPAGCKTEIDRGLDYACGGMHGADEVSCEGYFCPEHRRSTDREVRALLCLGCADTLDSSASPSPDGAGR